MRRAEALHPSALLVDQDERLVAFNRVAVVCGDLA